MSYIRYEYIRHYFDMGDLSQLNDLGSVGWKVINISLEHRDNDRPYVALLERPLHYLIKSRVETESSD